MAIEVAIGSQDDKLQTAALRWILANRENLNVKFELPDKPTRAQEYVYNLFHGLVLTKIKVEPKSDEIRLDNSLYKGGQLVRGGLELTFQRTGSYSCVMSARPSGEHAPHRLDDLHDIAGRGRSGQQAGGAGEPPRADRPVVSAVTCVAVGLGLAALLAAEASAADRTIAIRESDFRGEFSGRGRGVGRGAGRRGRRWATRSERNEPAGSARALTGEAAEASVRQARPRETVVIGPKARPS